MGAWDVTPAPSTYVNLAGGVANISNAALKLNGTYPSRLGAGSYSILKTTTTALTNQRFFASVKRTVGASSNNATSWRVDAAATSPIQIYVEDVGGI